MGISSVLSFVRFVITILVLRLSQRRPCLFVRLRITERMAGRRHWLTYMIEDLSALALCSFVTFFHGLQPLETTRSWQDAKLADVACQ